MDIISGKTGAWEMNNNATQHDFKAGKKGRETCKHGTSRFDQTGNV